MSIWRSVSLLVAAVLVTAACEPPLDAEKEMEAAAAAMERGDYPVALETVKRVVAAYPDYGDVRYFYGLLLRRGGRPDAARLQFMMAARIDSTHASAWLQLGLLAYKAGDNRQAINYLEKAESLGANHLRLHDTLAFVYREFEQADKAFAHLQAADRLAPGDPRFRMKLAILEKNSGNLRGAEQILRPIVKAHPDNWDAHLFLAETLKDLHELPEADSVLAIARMRNPRHPQLNYILGGIRLGMGMADSAEVAFRKALELRPDLQEARYGLAQALGRQGKHAEAKEVLSAFRRRHEAWMAGEESAKTHLTHWLQAVAHHDKGDLAAMETSLQEALAVLPGGPSALTLLWWLYHTKGQVALADSVRGSIGKVLGDVPLSEACWRVGKELLRRNQPKMAVSVLESAVSLAPDDPLALYYLIQAYEESGDVDKARKSALAAG